MNFWRLEKFRRSLHVCRVPRAPRPGPRRTPLCCAADPALGALTHRTHGHATALSLTRHRVRRSREVREVAVKEKL